MTNEKLPPLPETCEWRLTPDTVTRLNSMYDKRFSVDNCVTCEGKKTFRWYSQFDRSKIVTYDCNCIDQFKMHRYFLAHGIPVKYQRLGLYDADGVDPGAVDVVGDYFRDREDHIRTGTGLYLHGSVGTGKTLLGTLVVKQFLADGKSGMFSTFSDIKEDKSRGWADQEYMNWFNKSIRNCEVLMIDDPGKEFKESVKQIAFGQSLLDELVRTRSNQELPTIITSNYRPNQFAEVYGEYLGSLINEAMIHKFVGGEDYRVKKKERDGREKNAHLRRPITIQ